MAVDGHWNARLAALADRSSDRLGLQVADNDDLNVLGMNYLSTLSRWGVEGRWLILVS
jgi:aspartyl protease family protein